MEKEKEIKIPENLHTVEKTVTFNIPQTVEQSNVSNDGTFLISSGIIPTGVPRNPFDYFRLYINGATKRLYIYDSQNAVWLYSNLL